MIPYYELRYALMMRDIPSFIRTMKSVLASVSYSISKAKEGYFHSNVHLILTLLGSHVLSEEETNIGRIDAVIRFTDVIYIVEFKFGDNKDLSAEARDQIKEKQYAQKLNLERKVILGLGISFDEAKRNINGFTFERLSN
ncbi:PD-(D/E)XK nuclease domain-containing protein [Mucilaginibacter sp. SJ]|uniref:PD-(D/E)XK nuclease domain-containing protein n=1 Tax=Mucilaginibacter sp. SJ TaxID=3029053 RepID=UPI0023A9EF08|nr:PD-(D/E)XK nuclease domain-containing protein [Mucilaginibacter sp. SJ]WEA01838.1 PD-(D/E)XK nuclease domain-containing protein [Mucilaginibacter sp. SJ]